MTRDNVELPPIMEKCCQAIEKYGIRSQGIYRINGTSRKVTQLKEKLDKGPKIPFFGLRLTSHGVYYTFRFGLGQPGR